MGLYEDAKELLRGAVETHVHLNPHIRPEDHIMDALEYAKQAREAGMKAVVVKNVGVPNTGAAYFVNRIVNGFECFGSVAMNICNGGINPVLIKTAVTHGDGARIVFFPLADTLHHVIARENYYAGVYPKIPREKAITIIDKNGEILSEVHEVLEILKKHDRCLNTGHLSPKEVKVLLKEANKIGVKRCIVSHGMWQIIGHKKNDLKEYIDLGAFIEFEYYLCMPMVQYIHGHPPVNIVDMLKLMHYIGVKHSVMSTDFGQAYSPNPIDGLRSFIASLIRCGAKPKEIQTMVQSNPSFLVGI